MNPRERFQVNEVQADGNKVAFEIVQRTEDIQTAEQLQSIYNEIKRKKEGLQAQIDNLPRQKEILEADIKLLEKRLGAITPHMETAIKQIEVNRKAAEEKAKIKEETKEEPAKE